jgi:hypothetical protein
MGMRVSIEHADGNPDLVSVNHVNHSDIPYRGVQIASPNILRKIQ